MRRAVILSFLFLLNTLLFLNAVEVLPNAIKENNENKNFTENHFASTYWRERLQFAAKNNVSKNDSFAAQVCLGLSLLQERDFNGLSILESAFSSKSLHIADFVSLEAMACSYFMLANRLVPLSHTDKKAERQLQMVTNIYIFVRNYSFIVIYINGNITFKYMYTVCVLVNIQLKTHTHYIYIYILYSIYIYIYIYINHIIINVHSLYGIYTK